MSGGRHFYLPAELSVREAGSGLAIEKETDIGQAVGWVFRFFFRFTPAVSCHACWVGDKTKKRCDKKRLAGIYVKKENSFY